MYSRPDHSRYAYGRRRFFIGFFFLSAMLLLGAVVMFLWNAILPAVTSAAPLSYWQALGLLILSRILFGGIRFGSPNWARERRKAWKEKWINMNEEERARFREAWRKRCGKEE